MGARPIALMDPLRFGDPADERTRSHRRRRRPRHRPLRQLDRRGDRRRRDGLRPLLRRQPAGQRAVRRRARRPTASSSRAPSRPATSPCSSGSAPAATASAAPRCSPAPSSTRAASTTPSAPTCRSATPSRASCSSSRACSCTTRGCCRASRTWAPPASPARRRRWRRRPASACASTWTRCRCASRRWRHGRSSARSRRSGCSPWSARRELDRVLEICARWGVQATPIGEVIEGDRLVFTRHGEVVHDAPGDVAGRRGSRLRAARRGLGAPARRARTSTASRRLPTCGRRAGGAGLAEHRVQPLRVAAVRLDRRLRHLPGSRRRTRRSSACRTRDNRGIAIATDGNGRWCALDPAEGAKLVVAEAARNVACTGARPVAATNCLNFGSPERPEIMGQFRDVIRGMGAACEALGTPDHRRQRQLLQPDRRDGGPPHPRDRDPRRHRRRDARACRRRSRTPGDAIYLVGAPTRPGLGGSEYLWRTSAADRRPPAADRSRRGARAAPTARSAGSGRRDCTARTTSRPAGCWPRWSSRASATALGAEVTPEDIDSPPVAVQRVTDSRGRVSVADADAARLEEACAAARRVRAAPRRRSPPTSTCGSPASSTWTSARSHSSVSAALPEALGHARA